MAATPPKTKPKVKTESESAKPSAEKKPVEKPKVAKAGAKIKPEDLLKVPKQAFYATGRRKVSVAKVWLFPGKGTIQINKQDVVDYVKRPALVDWMMQPLRQLNVEGKYDVRISVLGGGISGQVGSCRLGIARALLAMNEEFRRELRKGGLLTRDPRAKERKKYGKRGARKGPQYRKR